jgi:hypothetical protein
MPPFIAALRFDATCDFADGKAGRLNLDYDVVTTLSR